MSELAGPAASSNISVDPLDSEVDFATQLAAKDEEIRRLHELINGVVEALSGTPPLVHEEDEGSGDSELDDEEDDPEPEPEPEDLAIWDPEADCYRCPLCGWEVLEDCGLCNGDCGRVWVCSRDDSDEEMHARDLISEELVNAFHPDRVIYSRGCSPAPADTLPEPIPLVYIGRKSELRALVARGASVAMCTRYHLIYDDATGIIALADSMLRSEYGGSAMLTSGALWYIYLGRQITRSLDDTDGETFMHDLLDDILFSGCGRWKNGLDRQAGSWITRPNASRLDEFFTDFRGPLMDIDEKVNLQKVFDVDAYIGHAAQAPPLPDLDEEVKDMFCKDEYESSDSDDEPMTSEHEGSTLTEEDEEVDEATEFQRELAELGAPEEDASESIESSNEDADSEADADEPSPMGFLDCKREAVMPDLDGHPPDSISDTDETAAPFDIDDIQGPKDNQGERTNVEYDYSSSWSEVSGSVDSQASASEEDEEMEDDE